MGKTGPKRTSFETERDRRDLADMYLQGWTQAEIADHLNKDPERDYTLTQQMISYDLLRLQKAWRDSALVDIDEVKANELAKVDRLEREYWRGWERSCEDAETVTQKTRGVVKKYRNDDGVFVSERPAEVDKTSKGQAGDPRFLNGVEWCIERRCKIFGVDAPTRRELTGKGGGPIRIEDVNETRDRLLEELSQPVEETPEKVAQSVGSPANVGRS